MTAMRCSPCDLFLPSDREECPVCQNPTWKVSDNWDADWEQQVSQLRLRHREGQYTVNIDEKVLTKNGSYFINSQTPKNYGYLDIESGLVLRIRNRFFEVSGAVFEETEHLGWLLELVEVEGAFDGDFPTLTDFEYQELEEKRGAR